MYNPLQRTSNFTSYIKSSVWGPYGMNSQVAAPPHNHIRASDPIGAKKTFTGRRIFWHGGVRRAENEQRLETLHNGAIALNQLYRRVALSYK
jgi:hypothetical protein